MSTFRQPLTYAEDKAVVEYYGGEFRRWHLKVVFMIAASIGIFYFTLLKSAWIVNWITSVA